MSNTKNNKYAQKIFTEDYPNIVKLYQDGYSVRKIAKKYGVVHSTITNILIKENVFEMQIACLKGGCHVGDLHL